MDNRSGERVPGGTNRGKLQEVGERVIRLGDGDLEGGMRWEPEWTEEQLEAIALSDKAVEELRKQKREEKEKEESQVVDEITRKLENSASEFAREYKGEQALEPKKGSGEPQSETSRGGERWKKLKKRKERKEDDS